MKAYNTVSLTVKTSEFHSCKASPDRGGGIYAEEIKTVTIEESLFQSCVAEAENNFGGGGIQLVTIHQPFTVKSAFFHSCVSYNDGGGLSSALCPAWQSTCFLDCSFIGCSASPLAEDNDAGSLLVWRFYGEASCSNILFVDSLSERRGGCSSYYIYGNHSHNSSIHLFLFCFFKNSTAKENTGNDVYFHDWTPTEPLMHCFSTTTRSPRLVPSEHQNNWLPQKCEISYLKYSQIIK